MKVLVRVLVSFLLFVVAGGAVPEFSLLDQEGKPFSDKELYGKTTMFNFIFTRCAQKAMCPATTDRIGEMQAWVKKKGYKDVQFVTVSFDPEYDTPKRLKAYGEAHGLELGMTHLLTGDVDVVKGLMKEFTIYTMPGKKSGQVNHTMKTVLIDKVGEIVMADNSPKWSAERFCKKIEQLHQG